MIPRFKPGIGPDELSASVSPSAGAVEQFEARFAETFGASSGIAFSYGRTALWALLKSLGLAGAEVVLPAYTCVVVAHAVVLSGNRCRFVDAEPRGYNMDLDQLAASIGPETRAIVPTHVFGIPMDCDSVAAIVREAEAKFGRKIYVIHDCAHSFGAAWRGRLVTAEGDAALFGLGISKIITSIFGGMITTRDESIARRLRAFRDETLKPVGAAKALSRQLYLAAAAAAFSRPAYQIVHWIEHETALLDGMTKAYHLDGLIHFPPDHLDRMSDVEASVGLVQLGKYASIIKARVANARFYDARLRDAGWALPPFVEGATYSHYVVRVPDRDGLIQQLRRDGIELGNLIQYSVPHMPAYGGAAPAQFPRSFDCSEHTINLPVHPGLSEADRERVLSRLIAAGRRKAA